VSWDEVCATPLTALSPRNQFFITTRGRAGHATLAVQIGMIWMQWICPLRLLFMSAMPGHPTVH